LKKNEQIIKKRESVWSEVLCTAFLNAEGRREKITGKFLNTDFTNAHKVEN
jgi:hypothetical protein